MKLYKRAGSPVWYFDAWLPDGTRIRESTREEKKADARAVAEDIMHQHRSANRKPGSPITVADAIDLYVETLAGRSSHRNMVSHAARLLGRRAQGYHLNPADLLHTMTDAHIGRLKADRRATGSAVQTITHEVGLLRSAIAHSASLGLKVPPPLNFKMPHVKGKTRYLSVEEFDKVYSQLDPARPQRSRRGLLYPPSEKTVAERLEVRDLFVALILTGGRWSEVARMTWDQIDLGTWTTIRLWGWKDREERMVPMPPFAASMFERRYRASNHQGPYVFAGRDGIGARAAPTRSIGKAMEAAGLNADHMVLRYGRATIHSLRHTAASWWLQAGMSLAEVQFLLGHASPEMTQRYAHLASGQVVARASAALAHIGRSA